MLAREEEGSVVLIEVWVETRVEVEAVINIAPRPLAVGG